MSYTIRITGNHKGADPATIERDEALIVAEVEALLPHVVSRLGGHGLQGVAFHGERVTKTFDTTAKP